MEKKPGASVWVKVLLVGVLLIALFLVGRCLLTEDSVEDLTATQIQERIQEQVDAKLEDVVAQSLSEIDVKGLVEERIRAEYPSEFAGSTPIPEEVLTGCYIRGKHVPWIVGSKGRKYALRRPLALGDDQEPIPGKFLEGCTSSSGDSQGGIYETWDGRYFEFLRDPDQDERSGEAGYIIRDSVWVEDAEDLKEVLDPTPKCTVNGQPLTEVIDSFGAVWPVVEFNSLLKGDLRDLLEYGVEAAEVTQALSNSLCAVPEYGSPFAGRERTKGSIEYQEQFFETLEGERLIVQRLVSHEVGFPLEDSKWTSE